MTECILMVEDEIDVLEANKRMLERRNCKVLTATNVSDALRILEKNIVDLLVLDVMLPDGSGYDVCEEFRKISDKPVLFLSAKTEVKDRIEGLKRGADYYITKPYSFDELYAVIERLLDREQKLEETKSTEIMVGRLTLDMAKAIATIEGKDISLTKTEFVLLSVLMQNKNRELLRDELYEMVWGNVSNQDTRVLCKHISKLRQKTDCENSKNYDILSSYGKGYVFIEH